MLIGVNRSTMPAEWSPEKCLYEAKRAGFECFEFNLMESGNAPSLTSTPEELYLLQEKARNYGVKLFSLSSSLFWKYPLTSNDPQTAEKAHQILETLITTASQMSLKTVLVVPGLVDVDTSYDIVYERSIKAIKVAAPFARSQNVKIGIENVWNKFLLSPLEFARFIDEIDEPNVGAYFDAGNVLVSGYPQHWIRILNHRIIQVHVKDFRLDLGNMSGFANPLQGDLPWQEVKQALEEIGYNGPICAEVNGYRTNPELGLKHIAEAMRSIICS